MRPPRSLRDPREPEMPTQLRLTELECGTRPASRSRWAETTLQSGTTVREGWLADGRCKPTAIGRFLNSVTAAGSLRAAHGGPVAQGNSTSSRLGWAVIERG
jgi:hypothetical protein